MSGNPTGRPKQEKFALAISRPAALPRRTGSLTTAPVLLDNTNIALMVATLREELINHPHIAPMVAERHEELARSRPRASWGAMRPRCNNSGVRARHGVAGATLTLDLCFAVITARSRADLKIAPRMKNLSPTFAEPTRARDGMLGATLMLPLCFASGVRCRQNAIACRDYRPDIFGARASGRGRARSVAATLLRCATL